MEFRQLGYFLHLANTGSVSQSAKALGLSQPSLSRQIQQLEEGLKTELFARHHRPMTLTDAGEFLYRHIKKPLHEIEQAMALTRRFNENRKNRLIIGLADSVLYGPLPQAISCLRQDISNAQSGVQVKAVQMSFDEQVIALKAGDIDVGFGCCGCDDPLIHQTVLRRESLLLALPKQHPLAKQKQAINLAELADDTLILHQNEHWHAHSSSNDSLLQLFESVQTQPKNHLRVKDIQVALAMVAAGEGFTIVPDSLQMMCQEQVSYLPLSHDFSLPLYINTLTHHPIAELASLYHAIVHSYNKYNLAITTPLAQIGCCHDDY